MIFVFQCNSFWDCGNGILIIFNVHNHINAMNNFIRFLSFTSSFVEVSIYTIYDRNRNFSELMNKSRLGSNGSNKNSVLILLFFGKLIFSFADETIT